LQLAVLNDALRSPLSLHMHTGDVDGDDGDNGGRVVGEIRRSGVCGTANDANANADADSDGDGGTSSGVARLAASIEACHIHSFGLPVTLLQQRLNL
jgi:hypothetical protein